MKKIKPFLNNDYIIMGFFALLSLILHLIAIKGYGYFRDEFYYLSCSQHLDFGYVDQPALSIFLLKLIRMILGESVIAIRMLPVVSAAIFVYLTGLIAKELGGKKFAIVLATATAFAPLGNFFLFNIYSMNFLDFLFWQVCLLIILRMIKTGNPKYWIAFGIVAGFGLENKISVLFLGFGLAVGLVLSKERHFFKSKYLWIGTALAGLLFIPYILWNINHGWAALEFMHNAKAYKMAEVSPLGFLFGQILYNNPITVIIWLAGLWYFFFHKKGKTFRIFGWMYLSIYILFTIQQAKDYYLAPVYPILFAGGAVFFETWFHEKEWKWPKPVLIGLILIFTLALCPITLPILPVDTTSTFTRILGLNRSAGEVHEMGVLPQHFADMHGWEEMVEKVAVVYNSLTSQEKTICAIYANNYGETGAVNILGKKYHLPTAYSGHNNYFFWPPTNPSLKILIIIGGRKEDHLNSFSEVTEVDRTQCQYCMPYENNLPIFLCKGLKKPLSEIWPTVKHFI